MDVYQGSQKQNDKIANEYYMTVCSVGVFKVIQSVNWSGNRYTCLTQLLCHSCVACAPGCSCLLSNQRQNGGLTSKISSQSTPWRPDLGCGTAQLLGANGAPVPATMSLLYFLCTRPYLPAQVLERKWCSGIFFYQINYFVNVHFSRSKKF